MNTSTMMTALGLAVLFLPLALLHPDMRSTQWAIQIELDLLGLHEQREKLAYCRDLQRLKLQIPLESTRCGHILKKDLRMTGDMLLESRQQCLPGWNLFGRRCRKVA